MFTVLICGGRDLNPWRVGEFLSHDFDFIIRKKTPVHKLGHIIQIIHGDAKGGDTGAKLFAAFAKIENTAYPADWNKLGNKAGPIRNRQMIYEGKPDLVIAFPGHTGTADMIKQAEQHKIPVIRVEGNFK